MNKRKFIKTSVFELFSGSRLKIWRWEAMLVLRVSEYFRGFKNLVKKIGNRGINKPLRFNSATFLTKNPSIR